MGENFKVPGWEGRAEMVGEQSYRYLTRALPPTSEDASNEADLSVSGYELRNGMIAHANVEARVSLPVARSTWAETCEAAVRAGTALQLIADLLDAGFETQILPMIQRAHDDLIGAFKNPEAVSDEMVAAAESAVGREVSREEIVRALQADIGVDMPELSARHRKALEALDASGGRDPLQAERVDQLRIAIAARSVR